MASYPKVSIVIVNWNKKGYIINLLSSLRDINYDNYEITVVDNASEDGSVEAIKEKFPDINLIANSTNLGGTGGFNTGIRYALEKGGYKYIWLLDNDAMIERDTLVELVKVMEMDETVGIAGSRILDPEQKDLTVEIGALFRWDTIGVVPICRNKRIVEEYIPREVDYVAICSALVRVTAVDKVGLMDERFFIFWDDMDWGLCFKENGFKVIAVPNSIVYHPSFTERKRGVLTDFYYGIRNPLLVYTKHARPLKRLLIFYNYLRYLCKGTILLLLSNRKEEAYIALDAIQDFCHNRWGKFSRLPKLSAEPKAPSENLIANKKAKRILIIAGDTKEEVVCLREKIKKIFAESKISLLVSSDREEVFRPYFSNILVVNSKRLNSISYSIWVFLKIILSQFDVAVCLKISLFSFAIRRTYFYLSNKDALIECDNNCLHIHKPILAAVLGEIAALAIMPFVYLNSFRYKKNN